jgi:hypothetical protein
MQLATSAQIRIAADGTDRNSTFVKALKTFTSRDSLTAYAARQAYIRNRTNLRLAAGISGRGLGLTPKPVFRDQALATYHHDGDRNRRDSFRIECSDLDQSRTDVHVAILRLREFRPRNQTRLTVAFFANVAALATGIPASHDCCRSIPE